MSLGVGHFVGDEMLIDVVAHRPDTWHFEDLKSWTPVNTLFAAQVAPGVSPEQRTDFQGAADDLTHGRLTDLVHWDPVTISVDGEETLFEVCRIVDEYWAAIGVRTNVHLTLHSRGLPVEGLSLVSIELQLDLDEPSLEDA
jgi:hypothetical protein